MKGKNMNQIKDFLKRNRLIMDGAMGTYYAQKFARRGEPSEIGNFDAPDAIRAIHMEYIKAGANLIRTNTFASNYQTLKRSGYGGESHNPGEVVKRNLTWGFNIARDAVNACGRPAFIAADIGPVPEYGGRDEQEILDEYLLMAKTFIQLGTDIILFETFSDLKYIVPVAQYIKEHSNIFVIASFCLNKFGYTKSGISAKKLLKAVEEESAIDASGFNCGIGAAHMYQILKRMDWGTKPILVAPNSGYPDTIRDRSVYQENEDYFSEKMAEISRLGVNIIGGCCGTTPEYIRKLAPLVQAPLEKRPVGKKNADTANVLAESGQGREAEKNPLLGRLEQGGKAIIVELDPPYNGDMEKMIQAVEILKKYPVDMITLSDSPMGKMRADSIMTGAKVQRELDFPVMPHLTCRDRNQIAMGGAFLGAHLNGIRNLLIVTGDPVPAGDRTVISSVYDFNSVTLMEYLKHMNEEYFSQDPIVYGGALNYGRKNLDKEIERMEKKIRAGASYFLTQPLYSQEDVDRIAYIKSRVHTKIFGGIMPLVSYRNALFMKNEIYGIHVPDEVIQRYSPDMSREDGEKTGIICALELMEKMQNVVDGYYFMVPFNRATMIGKIIEQFESETRRK
ncbi:bifunctional homocysteine S-methyltransferase/methylenetetrahydrofolate reductase [Catenibacillus scindens]|uniref:bifunctional homocysteine S-methyltransferase/methylenetetrahydrofolate reductase n=1 Tax=Catenibacillus scindens TaxID=673271 RepID=UPI0032087D2A